VNVLSQQEKRTASRLLVGDQLFGLFIGMKAAFVD
jgi:hypothetical protein